MRALWGISRRVHGMWRSKSGNVAAIFAISAVPLVALAGGAVDLLGALRHKNEMQSALDAATLAGVTRSSVAEEETQAANDYFSANYPHFAQLSSFSFQPSGDAIIGNAAMNVGTSFLKLIGIPDLPTVARSSATREDFREPVCFAAMHPTRKHTLELKDSVSVLAPDCNVYGNSNHEDDVVDPHTAANFLTGRSVQAIGYGHHYLQNVTPPLERAPELIPDPLASLPIPPGATDPCPAANTNKLINGGTVTLNPGVYCSKLTIQGGANVTLNSGTYFIKTGVFKIDGSTVTTPPGNHVKIVLLDTASKLDWKNSTVRLSGETTGPYAGIVMFSRVAATHKLTKSTIDLHGVAYLPNGDFEWQNNGTPVVNADWTVWIVDGVSWTGNGTIRINFDTANSSVPYPDALSRVIPRKGTPRLLY